MKRIFIIAGFAIIGCMLSSSSFAQHYIPSGPYPQNMLLITNGTNPVNAAIIEHEDSEWGQFFGLSFNGTVYNISGASGPLNGSGAGDAFFLAYYTSSLQPYRTFYAVFRPNGELYTYGIW